MDKIIYILIPIAYFFYQTYNNYVKEQEKAKKRNLGQPISENSSQPVVVEQEKQFDVKEFLKEKFNVETERKDVIKSQTKSIPEYQVKDYYNPEVPSAEVAKNRKIHSTHPHKIDLPLAQEEEKEGFAFNLRDAVIQQAILNRPYKY